ncbi:MAG: GFA family protein [Gammaproteobacteria bacterium]|nr:GFA family protein [Gammaproteobacteria bacterium]
MSWTGGCLCGAVRYQVGVDPTWVSHCHCSMCRKQTGALVGTYVMFPAGTVRWTATQPTRYRSSADVERSFCSTCGGTIGFHRVHETSLAVGSLDEPSQLSVDRCRHAHVWNQERVAWFDISDDWQRHDSFPSERIRELEELSGKPIRG